MHDTLARAVPPRWDALREVSRVASCFVCFERGPSGPGAAGGRGWAAACLVTASGEPVTRVVRRPAAARDGQRELPTVAAPAEPVQLRSLATARGELGCRSPSAGYRPAANHPWRRGPIARRTPALTESPNR
jgi:hypothetical protein